MSLLHAKAAACISKVESETPELTLRTGYCHVNIIDLNESDESEDREMGDQPNNNALGGFCLTSVENGTGRKRKEALKGLHEPQVKQVKLDHFGSAVGDKLLSLSRGGPDSGGPLVQNIAFDNDMDLVG